MAVKKGGAERNFRGVAPAQRREDRRERLLLAGIRQFGSRGFHNTTVRDVCTEAQLTERYFYESFDNLAALFVAVHGHVNDTLRALTLNAVMSAEREPIAMVTAALRVYLNFLMEDRDRGRVLLVESVMIGDDVLEHAAANRRDFASLLRGFVEFLFPQAAHQGFLIDMLCNGLIGATNYMAYDWVKEEFKTPLEDVLRTILSFYRGLVWQFGAASKHSLTPEPSKPRATKAAKVRAKPAAKRRER